MSFNMMYSWRQVYCKVASMSDNGLYFMFSRYNKRYASITQFESRECYMRITSGYNTKTRIPVSRYDNNI